MMQDSVYVTSHRRYGRELATQGPLVQCEVLRGIVENVDGKWADRMKLLVRTLKSEYHPDFRGAVRVALLTLVDFLEEKQDAKG